jgi:hypothetical protein
MLMGGSPEAMQTIQTAADPFNTLTTYLDQQNAMTNAAVQKGQAEAIAARQGAQTGLNTAISDFATPLQESVQQANVQRDAYNRLMEESHAKATPLEQTFTALNAALPGFGGTQLDDPYKAYLNAMNPNIPTAATLATPEQYARAQALQRLAGGGLNLPIGQETVSQAGTYTPLTGPSRSLEETTAQAYRDAVAHWEPLVTPKNVKETSRFTMPYEAAIKNVIPEDVYNQIYFGR